jgi:hypothetical protein
MGLFLSACHHVGWVWAAGRGLWHCEVVGHWVVWAVRLARCRWDRFLIISPI